MIKIGEYIKSPINYVGGKYRIISQLIPLFPTKINTFVDVFGGSGTVLLNAKAEHYIYNDINTYLAEMFEGIISQSAQDTINQVQSLISQYNLIPTDKSGFEKLRADYNNGHKEWIILYTLMCHSFNWQIRFNNKHQYNSSWGKERSYFTTRQQRSLVELEQRLSTDVVVTNKNFIDIDFSDFNETDFVYFDAPYFNSIGSYNDGKRGFEGWTAEHEVKLLELADWLNDKGVRFGMSNNLKYDNPYLSEWLDRHNYKVNYLNTNYSNCNYHKIDKSKDCEVLITNY